MNARFTGRHMATILVGGFAIVIGVNLFMARAAISTFGGLVVENSYVASQNFNGWLEGARAVKALGWQVALSRKADGRVQVRTADVPAGMAVSGDAWHPLGRLPDHKLVFAPNGDGGFVSTVPLPPGRWMVRLEVASGGKVWRGEQPLS